MCKSLCVPFLAKPNNQNCKIVFCALLPFYVYPQKFIKEVVRKRISLHKILSRANYHRFKVGGGKWKNKLRILLAYCQRVFMVAILSEQF